MHHYDYMFLKTRIPGNLLGLAGIISDLHAKEQIRKLQYTDLFEKLQKRAIIESVKSSNAIENIVTTDLRIKELVDGAAPVTHDELEISGYKDALNMIHTEHEVLDIDEATILSLHRMIQEQTSPITAGKYKTVNNFILETAPDGARRVRFKPVPAREAEPSMQQMLLAFYEARQDSEISPLLLIPCFILDFLCIHPFVDGNGRVSRLLTVLLLYASGYDIVRYISFERQVDKYKAGYYEALVQSSDKWHENENSYDPFIIFFLQILYRCFKELDSSFTDISLKKAKKGERVENILLNAIVPISKAEVSAMLPDISIQTVENVLSKLMKEGKLKKIGTYKDARYVRIV